MAVNTTGIEPIKAVFSSDDGQGEIHGLIVAFVWHDSDYTRVRGYWVKSPGFTSPGLRFIEADKLRSFPA